MRLPTPTLGRNDQTPLRIYCMIVFTHEHSYHLLVHCMARRDANEGSLNLHFIHATTILYHFAPLSTTCMFIIVQKLGNDKDFLRFSFKNIYQQGKKRPQILRSAVYDDILVVLTPIGVVGISPTF